jgi:hypothetical protein
VARAIVCSSMEIGRQFDSGVRFTPESCRGAR